MLLLVSLVKGFVKSPVFLIKNFLYLIVVVGGSSLVTESYFKLGLGETSEVQISMARIQVMIVTFVIAYAVTWYDQTIQSYRKAA